MPVVVVLVAAPKRYRLSDMARKTTMRPVGEDTQLYQVLRIDSQTLLYESRTATGRLLYEAVELKRDTAAAKRLIQHEAGRIAPRDCPPSATLQGRDDGCWE